MKRSLNKLVGISLLSLLLIVSSGQRILAQDATVSYQSFYDNLSPYGQWVSDPQYGNVWIPNESGDFRPYGTSGHWVMTDYGNTWVSDDPWGWACYHYGRWTYDPYYGWVWIPGYEWAPAWVSWRYGGGQCGWAPLGPGDNFNCPDSWWVFVAPQYMYAPDCFHHWRGPSYNGGYIRQTAIINNAYVDNRTHVRYNFGPRANVIEQDTHHPVQVYHVSQMNRPGAPSTSGNSISMYRPAINKATANTARPGNVVQAPRQLGRPQAATTVNASHTAPFRQNAQQPAPNNGGNRPPGNNNHAGNRQPGNNQSQPPRNNNQPAPQHNQPARNNQPMPRPQQQHVNPQPMRQQPAPQPRPMQQAPQPRPMQQAPQPRPMQQQAPRPMPQQAPRPMPAPAPHEEGGGRR